MLSGQYTGTCIKMHDRLREFRNALERIRNGEIDSYYDHSTGKNLNTEQLQNNIDSMIDFLK